MPSSDSIAPSRQAGSSQGFPWRQMACSLAFLLIVFGVATLIRNQTPPLPPLHFTLTDQHGQQVTEKNFLGKPSLIYFGFTRCPAMCPMALASITDLLAEAGQPMNALFITTDPAYDTPQVLAEYVQHFPANITGLTGSSAQLAPVYKAFRIYAGSEEDKVDSDHSGFIYLAGADGRILSYFNSQLDKQTLRRLLHTSLTSTGVSHE